MTDPIALPARALATLTILLCAAPAASQTPAADRQTDSDRIVVTGTRPSTDLTVKETQSFGLSKLDILEVPQSVQVLTRDLIDTSGALSLGDALQNVASASNALSRTVAFGTGSTQIRGQDVAIYRDGLRDVDFSDIDQSALNNVARVDVLKGPAGLVYGSGGPGGVINISTKRPLEKFAADVRVTLGSYATKIGSVDISVPLAPGLGVRVTGEIERSGSFIDFAEIERDNFSGVLAYSGGGLDAALTYENFANRDDRAATRVGLPAVGTIIAGPVAIDRNRYLGEPAFDFVDSFGTMMSGYASYRFDDRFALTAAARKTTVNFNQAEVRTLGAVNPATLAVARSRARRLALNENQYNARIFGEAKFTTGPVTHELIAGYEYFQFDLRIENFNVPATQVQPISVVTPVYRPTPFTTGTATPLTSTDFFDEFFVQDVARVGPVTVTGAVRRVNARFKDAAGLNDSQRLTLYQLGGALKLNEAVSVFGGYNTGYNANSGLAATRNRTGARFTPETYRQFEGGIKAADLGGFSGTISLFELTRDGILAPDPVDAAFSVQVGRERSRGVEAEVVWAPTPQLSLRAGYLYLDSVVVQDSVASRIGKRRPGAPEHQGNAFAVYTFGNGPLKNLRLNAGVTLVGSAFASLNNTVVRPAYAVANFGAGYRLGPISLDAFVSNAFDERYFIARNDAQVNVGDPRNFRVRVGLQF